MWILLSVFVAAYAGSKKVLGGSAVSFVLGFFVSMIFSPLLAAIAIALSKPNKKAVENSLVRSGEMKKCPKCAELVKREALKCRFCGFEFTTTNKLTQ